MQQILIYYKDENDPYVSPHISGYKSHLLYAKIARYTFSLFVIPLLDFF